MDIVIVDDHWVALNVLKRLVEKLPDSNVQRFTSAAEALDWCKQNEPALVIVDYEMPDLNGIEFTVRFRALEGRGDVPMLMVTANQDQGLREKALESGVNDFLNKPFDFADLQARVTKLLGPRQDGAV